MRELDGSTSRSLGPAEAPPKIVPPSPATPSLAPDGFIFDPNIPAEFLSICPTPTPVRWDPIPIPAPIPIESRIDENKTSERQIDISVLDPDSSS